MPSRFLIHLAVTILTLVSLAPASQAADKPTQQTYVARVSGIVCDGCKASIRESLTKLEGVTNIDIAPGSAPGTHSITVTTSASQLTKEQAITALGPLASSYQVQTWEKR